MCLSVGAPPTEFYGPTDFPNCVRCVERSERSRRSLNSACPSRRRRYPGRLPVDDRTALRAIVCMLRTGVSRRGVPARQAGCSRAMAWRRLQDRTEAGL